MIAELLALAVASAPLPRDHARVEILAAVLAAEARSEGRAGMLAVAEVIRNRGGSDPVDVVLDRAQFACLSRVTPGELVRRMRGEEGWDVAREVARILMDTPERLGNRTRGARWYSTGAPWWSRGKRGVRIGRHTFWR